MRRPAPTRPTRLLLIGLVAVLGLLASACAGEDGVAVGGSGTEEPGTEEPGTDEPTDGATAPAATEPGGDPAADPIEEDVMTEPEEWTGVLAVIDVEGGCTVLEVDGQNYELIASPQGNVAVDPANGVLASTEGEVLAEAGDEVTLIGQVDEGMMTFCQVGPVLVVESVEAG